MSDQPYRIKFRRDLDALTGSPEATDALLVRANTAASERVERVVNDEHRQGVVLAGWMLTFPEVLAAVLPDLLAEANTRADDAEAKARRFANLLGNINDVLPREVLHQKAEAWDEGYHAGHEDARAVQPTYPDPTPNPYRRGTEGESDRG